MGSALLAPSSGTNAASGSAVGYGQSSPPAPVSSILTSGTPADPGTETSGTTYNYAAIVNPTLTTTRNLSKGTRFNLDTSGMTPGTPVKLKWSQTVGYRSSRYWQLLVTTDGTNFSPVSGGTGSTITQTVNGLKNPSPYTPISGTASVTVSDTGLIDFRTIAPHGRHHHAQQR